LVNNNFAVTFVIAFAGLVFLSFYLFNQIYVQNSDNAIKLIDNAWMICSQIASHPYFFLNKKQIDEMIMHFPNFPFNIKVWLIYSILKFVIFLKYIFLVIYGVIIGVIESKIYLNKSIESFFPKTLEYDFAKKGIIGLTIFIVVFPAMPLEYYLQLNAEITIFFITTMISFGYFYLIRQLIINKPLQ